jgi:hypothetical protein
MEEWRPVVGYVGLYEVSSEGRVRRVASTDTRGYQRKERVLKQHPEERGHLHVTLCNGDRSTRKVHALMLESFVGPRPYGYVSRHLDGKPAHNVLGNLKWGTPSENQRDSIRHGTHPQASKTHCPQNHPYDEQNTRQKGKRRHCIICDREGDRRRYHRGKGSN